jgi:CRP/FNR family transcriptional regulator, anaerobic regulatory protein
MSGTLIDSMKSIGNFSEEEISSFINKLEAVKLPKGENFLNEGKICRYLGYVETGLLMYYRTYGGIDIPTDFATEHDWASNLNSFSNKIPSDVSIKALEDCSILQLSAENFGKIFKDHPKFILLKDYYTQLSFTRHSRHTADLAMLTAKERYYKFVAEKPDLVNRVPQYYIAAYLGIKPQSLSRIRK